MNLGSLDHQVIELLRDGTIRLMDAEYLRQNQIQSVERRQTMESRFGDVPYLTNEAAEAAMRETSRCVCVLSYCWRTRHHPDPDGAVLDALRRFLLEHPHIKGVFMDYVSLFQHPRTKKEQERFALSLDVMGDLYASPLATVVARFRQIPPRPEEFDGLCAIIGPHQDAEAELRTVLTASNRELTELKFDSQAQLWKAKFASERDADHAMVELADDASELLGKGGYAHRWYNERPYKERGWCVFESAIATEAIARVKCYPTLMPFVVLSATKMEKVIEIDGGGDDDAAPAESRPGATTGAGVHDSSISYAGDRVERVRTAIKDAAFTGKGDREVVSDMYTGYIKTIVGAMRAIGEKESGTYEGQRNKAGKEHGMGTMTYFDGSVYVGEWKDGMKAGRGSIQFSSGGKYEGEWKNDRQDGKGTFYYAVGRVYEGQFNQGDRHGHGKYWYPPKGSESFGHCYVGEYAGGTTQTIRTAHEGGVKEGKGSYFYGDGRVYVGGYVGGERDGLGTLYLPDGRVATLRFSSGVPVGDGILWDADLTSGTAVRLWAGDPVSGLLDASEMNESDDRAELAARKKAYMKKEEKAAGGKAMGVEATDRIDIGAAKKIAMGMGVAVPPNVQKRPVRPEPSPNVRSWCISRGGGGVGVDGAQGASQVAESAIVSAMEC